MLAQDELKARMLKNPAVRKEYERLEREEFALLDLLLEARRKAGLTQAQVAERMGTQAPAVARLESALASGKHSPSVATVRRYLAACGRQLVVNTRRAA